MKLSLGSRKLVKLIFFLLTVAALALAHLVSAYLVTLIARQNNTPFLLGLAENLRFPSQFFPRWVGENDWIFLPAFFLSSFLFWTALVGLGVLAYRWGGIKGTALWCLVLLTFFFTFWWKHANPPPNWNTQAHRYLEDFYFFLPEPLIESQIENDKYQTVFRSMHPDKRFRLPATRRWYWKYRVTLSGFPEYNAAVVATPASAAATRGDFLKHVADQAGGPSWVSSNWKQVSETDRWILETATPNRTSKASSEKNRLIRVVAKSPSNGVWIGLVAREKTMARDIATRIVERAMESVHPLTEEADPLPAPAASASPESDNP